MADETEYRIPIIADIGELLAGFQQAGEQAKQMGDDIASAGEKGAEGLKEMGEAGEEAGSKMGELKEGVDKQLESLGKMMTGWQGLLGVLGAGAAGEVLAKVTETTIDLGDSMSKTAGMLDVGFSSARGFNEAMESLGVSSSAVSMAIRGLEVDAVNGGKRLSEIGVSARDANGHFKDGITIFRDVISALQGIEEPGLRSALALQLLGRSGAQLLAVLDDINPAIDRNTAEQNDNVAANNATVDSANELHKVLTELNSAWENFAASLAPAVINMLKAIGEAIKQVTPAAQGLLTVLQGLVNLDYNKIKEGFDKMGESSGEGEEKGRLKWGPTAIAIGNWAKSFWDSWNANQAPNMTDMPGGELWGNRILQGAADAQVMGSYLRSSQEAASKIEQHMKDSAEALREGMSYSIDAAAQIEKHTEVHLPEKKGRHAGAGDVEDAQQMDNALEKAAMTMDKLNGEYARLGNESQMASKVSQDSYATLAARASADFELVKERYAALQVAIESGSKKAAAEAAQAWHDATQKFQQDWDAARAKAEADMQAVKAKADQLAGEVSSILDNAITGKLNWAQEMEKVLQKMLNSLVKYVFEMIAKWNLFEQQKNAATATGEAEGQAIQKTANASTIQSDAGTAAANAYKAVAGIPYIGPFLAPAAAAVAYAGVMAFSAEAGFDVPPGLKPLTQLHPREMVLPESLATNVRNMSSAGAGGGPGAVVNQNINLQAWDGQSVIDMLLGNGGAIAGALGAAMRSGMMVNTGG